MSAEKWDAIKAKLDNNQELDEKDRKLLAAAVKFMQSCFYEQVPDTPFICGTAGNNGPDNMPEYYFIAPTYGVDGFAVYKKDKDYDAPGY